MTQKETEIQATETVSPIKRSRGTVAGAVPFPRNSLKETLSLAEAIWRNNAGDPFDPILLAQALDTTHRSSKFTTLLTSSERYGLTEGGAFAKAISLTDLGKAIVAPTDENQIGPSLRQALLTPKVFEQFYNKYNRKNIPTNANIIKTVIERELNVPRADVEACYRGLMVNIEDYKLSITSGASTLLYLDNLGKSQTLSQESSPASLSITEEASGVEELPETHAPSPSPIKNEQVPKQIFVAHGKNKKPLEQLIKILQKYKIPHVVATDEPHKGRPIGVKVADEMKKCTAGIFIFTGDEETKDQDGNVVMRPSDNVVYELGAGSVLYGNKIVIFREEGVDFPSDFTEFGRITFEKNKLDAKGLDLMTELAGLEIIKFSVTG